RILDRRGGDRCGRGRVRRASAKCWRGPPSRSRSARSSTATAEAAPRVPLKRRPTYRSRGAFNAVMARLERPGGAPPQLVTASAGNHGRALTAAADTFRLPLIVFTPASAPKMKLEAIRRHGAELRADGRDYDDAERRAKAFATDAAAAFISPYNDADVIAGAATVALE